ncbi:IreB family regulatory phosphoprotein [Pseudoruminococcus massiliensis]|uniref:IreB family regulatory phosphoprotein n=2 Tax=Pseudoruminococcus massiliensis TaxID=2086583 RepID=UPI000D10C605|nr:IreB family regulatory phosphoprotein [Pseudoruminococcus massiliensis]MBE5713597.1 IreB family regulatory phosphoprotein [Oscillospiraceae bacterium]RHO46112.1 IreB family regulatory phosphoprotein [Clostridium sp. AM09-51]
MQDKTMVFSINGNKDESIRVILTTVYKALEEKGYNPLNQIVGYILSEDPTYITTHNNARNLIRKIDRDDLLEVLLKNYLNL